MRWAVQAFAVNGEPIDDDNALPGLQQIGLVRSARAPQFEGQVLRRDLPLIAEAAGRVPVSLEKDF